VRDVLCKALVRCAADPRFVFLTGDLGYGALEALQAAAGPRFINAGVAEQNMIGVAAGLAHSGFKPWAYSIAPFVYARPYEQIRNDICLHNLGVRLIGNGGGYGYGVMGATHHALEDYGALLCLQNMHVVVPAFDEDVEALIPRMAAFDRPVYIRLGRDERPVGFKIPPYAPWRRLVVGHGPALVVVGPLAGSYLAAVLTLPESVRPNLWVVSELPLREDLIPAAFWTDLARAGHLIVAEEHVAHGSAGHALGHLLLTLGQPVKRFSHLHAKGYLSGHYGSQVFHRTECGLDAASLLRLLEGNEFTCEESIK
jgi:transketolase